MKLNELGKCKVVYFRDTNCQYYWDFKYVVEIDECNFALINHGGSYSGWDEEFSEFVDKEFVYPFFKNSGWDEEFRQVEDKTLDDYMDCDFTNENGVYYGDEEVIIIDKEFVLKKMKEAWSNE